MDGTVAGLWRYPVAGMLGEELDAVVLEGTGPLGDDAFVVVPADADPHDPGPDGAGNALLDFRATCAAEPEPGAPLPPVDVLFPDGSTLRTDDDRVHAALSGVLGREVRVEARPPGQGTTALRLMTAAARERSTAEADDPRRARPHVVVSPALDDAVADAGSLLALGATVRVEVGTTGDDVPVALVAAGEVRVGDVVSG